MKIFVSGASGMLGSAICKMFNDKGYQTIPIDRSQLKHSSPRKFGEKISKSDVVIHAAANTDVEQCELDPDSCYRDNFLLTDFISKTTAQAQARMVYISSTGVYGNYRDLPTAQATKPHTRNLDVHLSAQEHSIVLIRIEQGPPYLGLRNAPSSLANC